MENVTFPRQAVLAAASATSFSTGIGTTTTGIILALSLYSFYEHRESISFTVPASRWRIPLLMSVLFSFLVFIIDGVTVWRHWDVNQAGSCSTVSVFITLFYVFEKQFLNLFLYDKAKLVHLALNFSARKEKLLWLLRWGLWLTLVVGVPVSFYWAAFIALAGKVAPEGDCIYFAVFPIVPILFAIADTCLALGMLTIFIVPLWEHRDAVKQTAVGINSKTFDKMIHRNIKLSLIAITSGVFGLFSFASLNFAADGTAATDHLRIWALFCISWDNLVSIVAVHMMTHKWLPRRVLKHLASSTINSTNEFTTSPTSKPKGRGDGDNSYFSKDRSVSQNQIVSQAGYD